MIKPLLAGKNHILIFRRRPKMLEKISTRFFFRNCDNIFPSLQKTEKIRNTSGTDIKFCHRCPNQRCETELVKVDGRKLDFKVEVYDECDLIGKGTHSRFIVKNDKFQIKANGKLGKA